MTNSKLTSNEPLKGYRQHSISTHNLKASHAIIHTLLLTKTKNLIYISLKHGIFQTLLQPKSGKALVELRKMGSDRYLQQGLVKVAIGLS